MPRIIYTIVLAAIVLLASCKSETKATAYSDLSKEKPVTILIAPVQDNAKRMLEKNTQDRVFNEELTAAAHYLRQTLAAPLASQGYYTIAPLASDIILQKTGLDYRQLMMGNMASLNSAYGIDAVLLVAIHKWQQPEINEVVVYTEYTLRSTKSGLELMHTWVRGDKIQPVDIKGEPIEPAADERLCPAQPAHQREPVAFSARPLHHLQPGVLQFHHLPRRQHRTHQLFRRRFRQ